MFPAWSVQRSHGKDVEVLEERQLMGGSNSPRVFSEHVSTHLSLRTKRGAGPYGTPQTPNYKPHLLGPA